MQDTSAFGIVINVTASNTFPSGFTLSAFADDADPFDIPELKIKDKAMGLNGDLIVWSKAMPIDIKIAVIEGSQDDINLGVLLEANRVGRGKSSAQDVVSISAVYPSGNTLTLSPGTITDGMTGSSVSSSGRLKTKTYGFTFENRTGNGF
jgi:hypothetical protein